MVAGHLDEVGFMITQIDDKGFLRFQTVGGWWSQVMLAQRVTIVKRRCNRCNWFKTTAHFTSRSS